MAVDETIPSLLVVDESGCAGGGCCAAGWMLALLICGVLVAVFLGMLLVLAQLAMKNKKTKIITDFIISSKYLKTVWSR